MCGPGDQSGWGAGSPLWEPMGPPVPVGRKSTVAGSTGEALRKEGAIDVSTSATAAANTTTMFDALFTLTFIAADAPGRYRANGELALADSATCCRRLFPNVITIRYELNGSIRPYSKYRHTISPQSARTDSESWR